MTLAELQAVWDKKLPAEKNEEGLEAMRQEIAWREKQLPAITAEPGPRFSDWTGGYFLGGGSFGVACAWMLPDEHQRVIDIQVLKDSYFSLAGWNTDDLWYGDREARKTTELAAMQRLWQDPRLPNDRKPFIQLRGFSPMDHDKRFQRLYMEYCQHGDLSKLIEEYQKANSMAKRKATAAMTPTPDKDYIPEPFLWYVFQVLFQACSVMEQGCAPRGRSLATSWHEPIVHRDIKTENLFLSVPDSQDWPSYPRPVLADFGLCRFLPSMGAKDVYKNPSDYQNSGTQYWRAPEQESWWKREDYPDWKVQSYTNVWAVGAVVARLIDLDMFSDSTVRDAMEVDTWRRPDYSDYAKRENWFGPVPPGRYSPELLDLVRRCIAFDPDNRPTAWQALRYINQSLDPNGLNRGKWMETAPAMAGSAWALRNLRAKYRLGMQMPNEPDPETGNAKVE